MVHRTVVCCLLPDQTGLGKFGERFLEGKVSRIPFSKNKIGNLSVCKRKIHLAEHVQNDQFIECECFCHSAYSFLKSVIVFALPDISFSERFFHLIENQPLVSGPEGSGKQRFRTVSGQTVDNNIRSETAQAGPQKFQIFFHGWKKKWVLQIIVVQIGILEYVEQLKLDPLDILSVQILYCFQHISLGFTGQI